MDDKGPAMPQITFEDDDLRLSVWASEDTLTFDMRATDVEDNYRGGIVEVPRKDFLRLLHALLEE
jgi:hypothetical protein